MRLIHPSMITTPEPHPIQEQNLQPMQIIESPASYQNVSIDYLMYVKIGNIIFAGFMLIWIVLLFIGNWSTYSGLVVSPTVNTVLYFGYGIVIMMTTMDLVGISLLVQFWPGILKTAADDLKVVLIALNGVVLVGGICILVWTFKFISFGINMSIILTLFYPLASGGINYYLLTIIQQAEIEVSIKLPTQY